MEMPRNMVADEAFRDVCYYLPEYQLVCSGRRRVGHGGIPEKVSSCRPCKSHSCAVDVMEKSKRGV